jgi:lipoprotein NlpD
MKQAASLTIIILSLSGCALSRKSPPLAAPPPVTTGAVIDILPPAMTTPVTRPAWELRPVTANAVTIDGKRYHKVAAGETGIGIARAYGIGWSRLIEANGLQDPFVIKAGQKLLLPEPGAMVNSGTGAGVNMPSSATPSIEARARAFHLDIDDIVTGSEPARRTPLPASARSPRFSGRFDWPATGRIVSRFGPAGAGRINQGIDIAAAPGSVIRAAADGVVAYIGNDVPGYGGLILIRHGETWISAYGHAATARVKRGATVKRGAIIGQLSADAAPTLHFELRRDRKPVDPAAQLPPR